jgi:FkbM family methyltransferase
MKLKGTIFYSYLSKFKNGFWLPHLTPSQKVLEYYFNSNPEGNLLKIGSFDGITNDPLYNLFIKNENWKGDFIEPVSFLFERLEKNLSNIAHRVRLHKCAIGERDEIKKIYFIRSDKSMPGWIEQTSSLNLNMLTRLEATYPGIKNKIESEETNTYSFDSFLRKNQIKDIDLLHIDTEGYDSIILNSIDFEVWNIPLIMFEHVHMNRFAYRRILKVLSDLNYRLSYWEYDTIAIKHKNKF